MLSALGLKGDRCAVSVEGWRFLEVEGDLEDWKIDFLLLSLGIHSIFPCKS